MKNILLILVTLISFGAYSQTIPDSVSVVLDTLKLRPIPQETQVDTTNGIKTRVVNNKVYYIKETQIITIKHEEED